MSKQIEVAAKGTGLNHDGRYTSGYHLKENANLLLTYPTAIDDGLPDPFQVKVLKSPDGGTQDDPKGTVREGVHGCIYASKNDARRIEDNCREIGVVAR